MSHMSDPNPGFGKSTVVQKLYAAGVMLYLLPKTLLWLILARSFKRHDGLSFKEHFTRVMINAYAKHSMNKYIVPY